jgi:drug/metabolite transporter (DMT)-like permease
MISPLLLDYASSLGRAILLAPLAARRLPEIRGYWRDHRIAVIAIAIFNPLAYILVLYALTFTPVVYVAPTREISVLLTVLMGSLLLGEGDMKRRLKWALVILTGVSLLATG